MQNKVYSPHKSSLGDVDANYIAVACYGASVVLSMIPVLKYIAWLAPLVIYFLEKKSLLVKFHAIQALILNAIGAVLSLIAFIIGKIIVSALKPDYTVDYYLTGEYAEDLRAAAAATSIFAAIAWIIAVGLGILQVLSALKAYKYSEYKLPVIGGIADKVTEKLSQVNFGGTNDAAPPPPYTPPGSYTPPAPGPYTPPPAQPKFDPQTGAPLTPPPPQPKFDPQTGLPLTGPEEGNTGGEEQS